MAGMPNSTQAFAYSSGTQEPSRKLKADRAWSSTNCIFHRRGAENAEKAQRTALRVPLRNLSVLCVSAVNKLLVITPLHEPPPRLAIDPVQRSVRERDIPLVARPWVDRPPVSRCAPGARILGHLPANAFGGDEARLPGSDRDTRCPRRPEDAQRQLQFGK